MHDFDYFLKLKVRLIFASLFLVFCAGASIDNRSAVAQLPEATQGDAVPRDVREMYYRGLQYLAKTQDESGAWSKGSESGGGSTGLAVMVFLASGEDPNFGIYSNVIRKALRSL